MLCEFLLNKGHKVTVLDTFLFSNNSLNSYMSNKKFQVFQEDVYNLNINFEKNFVKGSRKKRSLIETSFTFFMSVINSILFRRILYDIHAQPNLFHKSLIKNFDFLPNDMSLDLYMMLNAKINDCKILRFKVNFLKRKFGIGANENLSKKV